MKSKFLFGFNLISLKKSEVLQIHVSEIYFLSEKNVKVIIKNLLCKQLVTVIKNIIIYGYFT